MISLTQQERSLKQPTLCWKSVRAIASHCVMSDPASFRVQESGLTEMVFTDSIPYAKKCAKVKQLSIADMFAETIKRVMNNESISSQYII